MLNFLKQILYKYGENRADIGNDISYKELQMLMKKQNISLIDVRSGQEYEEGHLAGAINIPVYNLMQEIGEKIKDKNNTIIVYCSSGSRSKKAKEILEKLGYKEVFNLKEGIDKLWIR